MSKKSKAPTPKKPFYLRWWFIALVVICLIGVVMPKDESDNKAADEEKVVQTEKKEEAKKEEPAKAETEEKEEETKADTKSDSLGLNLQKVRKDSTGNWRIAVVSDSDPIDAERAYQIYEEYLKDHKDITVLGIVNLTLNTSTSINNMNPLYVTTYEYIDGEEHDANTLFTGDKLTEIMVDTDTGEEIIIE